MKTAATVRASRVKPKDVGANRAPAVSEYDEGPFVDVSALLATRLRLALASPGSYDFGTAKGCSPAYGVRIRFESSDETLDVNLCFDCNILEVTRNGESVGGEDFDSIRKELVAICKEVFRDDAEIQELDPRRPNRPKR